MWTLTLVLLASSVDLLGLTEADRSLPDEWLARPVRGFELPGLSIVDVAGGRAIRVAGVKTAGWWSLRLDEPIAAGRLSWTWRVLEQPGGADLRDAAADDSALRVFLVFGPPDISAPSSRAIFYTWGHSEPSGFRSDSHRSDRFHVIRLAGSADVGEDWRAERVDPFRDYRRIWSEAAPPVSAIGFMQDTDQTRRRAIAELRELRLQAPKLH